MVDTAVMDGNKDKISYVAQLLENASNILRGSENQQSSTSSSSSQEPIMPSSSNQNVQTALNHARNMIRNSSRNGTFTRLSRTERLRSTPYSQSSSRRAQDRQTQKKKKKPMEFALLKCFGDDNLSEEHNLKWDSVIASGMIMLDEEDDEKTVRNFIKGSVGKRFPMIGCNDFEFVKVRQKKIMSLDLGPNTEYNYSVVKKMAGQGMLYIKVKEGYEFTYGDDCDDDIPANFLSPAHDNTTSNDINIATPAIEKLDETEPVIVVEDDKSGMDHEVEIGNSLCECDIISYAPDNLYEYLNKEISEKELTEPVEILRFLQERLIKGRQLDVVAIGDGLAAHDPQDLDNATNYICVDRENILQTTFAELESIEDFAITFEVDFMGEVAKDYGGPRKEWIRLVNCAMKLKYFDNGFREFLANDYYYVGVLMGIALLQNGQLPTILPLDVIESLRLRSLKV